MITLAYFPFKLRFVYWITSWWRSIIYIETTRFLFKIPQNEVVQFKNINLYDYSMLVFRNVKWLLNYLLFNLTISSTWTASSLTPQLKPNIYLTTHFSVKSNGENSLRQPKTIYACLTTESSIPCVVVHCHGSCQSYL